MLLTVPYGRPADHGWFRVFGPRGIAAVMSATGDSNVSVTVFAREAGGWQVSSTDEAADADYGDGHANAVACIEATL